MAQLATWLPVRHVTVIVSILGLVAVASPAAAAADGAQAPPSVIPATASERVELVAATAASGVLDVGAAMTVAASDPPGAAADRVDPTAASDTRSSQAPSPPRDTTQTRADTTPDTDERETDEDDGTSSGAALAVDAPEPAAPTAPAVVREPLANVNVSVRIDSAGDNGPVSQVNVGVGAAPPTEPPAKPSATPAVSQSAVAAPVTDPRPRWNWDWDCVTPPSIPFAISEIDLTRDPAPESWTWNWNCGGDTARSKENGEQYRREITVQYLPINLNVSIRVRSPGNDGDVFQANVAVGASSGAASAPTHGGPLATAPSALEPPATIAVSVETETETGSAPPAEATWKEPAPPVELPVAVATPLSDEPVEVPFLGRMAGGWATVPSVVVLAPPTGRTPRAGVVHPFRSAPLLRGTARIGAVRWVGETAGVVDRVRTADGRAHTGGVRKRVPRPMLEAPGRSLVLLDPAPITGTSAAPAGGGGSTGGLPVALLALPFLAAVLDLARRVALSRVTWPRGHCARRPDRPG